MFYLFTMCSLLFRIKSVPPSVSLIPPLAYNCALYNLKPSVLKGWSNEACVLFKKLMSEKTGTFFMYPIETDGERYEVDVVWKEDIYPLSIRDAMFFLGHCAYEFFDNGSLVSTSNKFQILLKKKN